MTRSWVHFAHGRVEQSIVQSPLGAALFAGLLLFMSYLAGRSLGLLPALRLRLSRREIWLAGAGLVLGTAINWLYLEWTGVAL
jgi:hypothetical protein